MPLAAAARLRFDVEMGQVASGHQARIDVRMEGSDEVTMHRVLAASDCEKLASAISVAVALALGVGEGAAAGAPSFEAGVESSVVAAGASEQQATSPAAGELASPDAGTTGARVAEGSTLVPALSVWLLGDVGSLPSPAPGVALGAELGWRRFELRALGTMLFGQEATASGTTASGAAAGARLDLLTASVAGCAAPFGQLRAPLSPVLCLGMEVGRLSGVGTGVDFPRRGSAIWAAPLVQAGLVWRIPRTALDVSSNLLAALPLNRDQFALAGIGSVHQPPPVVGRWSLGFGMHFD